MKRGGKNYKKKTQFPQWDLGIVEKNVYDNNKIKQPYDTNQPYEPSPFAEVDNPEPRKKSG